MADFDFGTALSGATSGAAAGSSFGPWGTVIGGTTGFLSGFLGDDDENPARQRAIDENRERLRALTDDLEAARETDPTQTSFFNVGATELQEQAERQAETDAAQAAARGLEGSQFEVAQDANRAGAQAEGFQSLLRSAEQFDRQREARLFEATQRQRENLNALLSGSAQSFDRQQARQGETLQSTFRYLPFLLSEYGGGSDGGGGGRDGSALDALVDPLPTGSSGYTHG